MDLDYAVAMGDGAPLITGGYGGWTSVDRPDDISFTEWPGSEPVRQSVPIVFSGLKWGESQEEEIREILKLARHKGEPPPVFTIHGAIHHKKLRWVMESVEFGDPIRSKKTGKVIFQPMTLNIMEYIDPDEIKLRRKKKRKKKHDKERRRGSVHRAKQGDTMVKMAVRFYRDRKKWRLIRAANPRLPRDPRKVIPKGTKVKIPAG